jgi:hypothetical protein
VSSRASQRPATPGAHDEPHVGPPDEREARPDARPEARPDARPEPRPEPRHDHDTQHDTRPTFERILPELIRRGFEAGRGPLEKVSESIFPKDIAAQIVSQLGDVRSGVVKAVAQEVGRFLREADIAAEVRKVLTGLTVEAKVQLRFNQREDGSLSPKLDISLEDSAERTERKKPR